MKELAIKEEVLDVVRKMVADGQVSQEVAEKYFPQLKESKESEDGQIRKEIVSAINIYCSEYHRGTKVRNDMLDWLEKQSNPIDINPSEFDLRLNKLLKQFETLSKEELANSLSFYLNVVQNDGTYKPDEKQGEQKHVPYWMPKFLDELRSKKNYFDWDEHKDIEGGILAIIKWMNPNYFNEKDGEQKPYGKRQECVDCQFNYAGECKGSCTMKRGEQKSTDKVEPKFHKKDLKKLRR
jgi:polyhydroxyalkanoate synthesis regulator phasin